MLIFLGESEARTLCKTDIEKVNPPAIVSKTKMMAYVLQVADWCKGSKTAQAVMSVVRQSPVKIYVVGMKGGGFSCFNSDYPEPGSGTIYYNVSLDLAIAFKSTGPHDQASKVALDKRSGQRTTASAQQALHNYIGFLHELGHAKQFIETPLFVDGSPMNQPKFAGEIESAARTRKDFWANAQDPKQRKLIADTARKHVKSLPEFATVVSLKMPTKPAAQAAVAPGLPGVPSAPGIPAAPGGIPGAPPLLAPGAPIGARRDPYQLAALRVCKPQWGVRIETDNLIKHEWPICDELGYPKRNYTDLVVLRE